MLCTGTKAIFVKMRERETDTEREGESREEKQAHSHLRGTDYMLGTKPGIHSHPV